MGKFIDMTGWVMSEHGVPNSRLTVIERAEDGINSRGYPLIRWLCECNCEKHTQIIVGSSHLRSGHTQSCGCLKNEKIAKQGYLNKKYNTYDLSGDYGVGYTLKGEKFYFDLEDYNLIKDHCWHMEPLGYLASDTHGDEGVIKMHRLVMGVDNSNIHIDHVNHITFDNRKINLRPCGAAENNWNVGKRIDNKSGYPGVCWHKRDSCWEAYIQVHKKPLYLGRFDSLEEAIRARKDAEEKYFKNFSYRKSQEVSTYVQ